MLSFWEQIIISFVVAIVSPATVVMVLIKFFDAGIVWQKFKRLIQDVEELKKDTHKLRKSISQVHRDITVIKNTLINYGASSNLFEAKSPLRLTQAGKAVIEKTGFLELFNKNRKSFINLIRKRKPDSESEIDQAALDIVYSLDQLGKNDLSKQIKEQAYQSGIALPTYLRTIAIFIREEAIKELLEELNS